jgi:parallel beta-helix repeat protein
MVDSASYVVFQDATSYFAKNGTTGKVEFSGANATTIIQNAIDECVSGGLVFIREGNYQITTTLTVSDVTLEGTGIPYESADAPELYVHKSFLWARDKNMITVENGGALKNLIIANYLTGYGPMANNPATVGATVSVQSGVSVQNCFIWGGNYGITGIALVKLEVIDCIIKANQEGIYLLQGGATNNEIHIQNCIIRQQASHGIYLQHGRGCTIVDNLIENISGIGIHVMGGNGNLIQGNWFEMNIGYDIFILNTTGLQINPGNITIRNNVFVSNNPSRTGGSHEIDILAGAYFIIEGNVDLVVPVSCSVAVESASVRVVDYRLNSFLGSVVLQGLIKNNGIASITTSTTATFDHLLYSTPTLVLASFNLASYGNYTWSATSTQITITVSTSGTYTVYWHAEV